MKTINRIRPSKGLQYFIDDFFNHSMSEVLGTPFKTSQPSVNIYEDDKAFFFDFAVPGLTKKDFNIEVEKGILKVSTNKPEAKEQKSESKETESRSISPNYKKQEFNFNGFERSFHIPETADENQIEANYKNGILKLELKKMEADQAHPSTKKIEIS